jgi:ubiquinone/menaquinone biosynthesis C-methylase UbiE
MSEERPAWLFDENAGHRWMDAVEVEAYEAKFAPDLDAERELLRSIGLAAHHVLIDFGAGTGIRALEAAALCRRVIAVDPSAAMLGVMRRTAERRGIRNVEFVQRGFLTYEHQGEPADFAITRHALHLLPDFWKVEALRRVRAALKPRGVFFLQELVYSFEPADAAAAVQRWVERAPDEGEGPFSRAFFEEHVREKYSTYAWLFEEMLTRTGFDVLEKAYAETQAHAQYTCVKRA